MIIEQSLLAISEQNLRDMVQMNKQIIMNLINNCIIDRIESKNVLSLIQQMMEVGVNINSVIEFIDPYLMNSDDLQ